MSQLESTQAILTGVFMAVHGIRHPLPVAFETIDHDMRKVHHFAHKLANDVIACSVGAMVEMPQTVLRDQVAQEETPVDA